MLATGVNYLPSPEQLKFHMDEHRFRGLTGLRWRGKTETMIRESLAQAANRGPGVFLVRYMDEVNPTIARFVQRVDQPWKWIQGCGRLEIADHAPILITSPRFDLNHLRGLSLDWFAMDNLQNFDPDHWDFMVNLIGPDFRDAQKGKKLGFCSFYSGRVPAWIQAQFYFGRRRGFKVLELKNLPSPEIIEAVRLGRLA